MKYEDIHVNEYAHVPDLMSVLAQYFQFDDDERLHQSLGYRTPGGVYRAGIRGGVRGGKR